MQFIILEANKKNNLLIVISYTNFKMKELKLMSKIVIQLKQRKKKDKEFWLDIHKIEEKQFEFNYEFLKD